MIVRNSAGLALALLFALLGCSDSPTYAFAEGDACRTLTDFCVDAGTAMHCADGRWQLRDCAEYCEGLAVGVTSSGCQATSKRIGECICEPPADGCQAGDAVCIADGELSYCTSEWQWSNYSCTELCAAHPTHTASLGCLTDDNGLSACYCTTEGVACADEIPSCVDQSTIAICDGGTWAHLSCEQVCGSKQASCEPNLAGGAACSCE